MISKSLLLLICLAFAVTSAFDLSDLGFLLSENDVRDHIASNSPFTLKGQPQTEANYNQDATSTFRPVVQMHGMGDYADNPMGMIPFRDAISKRLNNTYVVNAKLASSDSGDQMGEFFQSMDEEIDSFAKFVRADEKLKNGFNAIGYSQGNLIIRGYIEKYNSPAVFNWVSLHGPLAGVAGFPKCTFSSSICQFFDKWLVGSLVYTSFVQNHLAQANYYRDPNQADNYYKYCNFLPEINNERSPNATFNTNFNQLEKVLLIKALGDTMIYPNDSEWFGFYEDGSTTKIIQMNETNWYKKDLFGLKGLDQARKIDFMTTPGDHLRIEESQLLDIAEKYFSN